MDLRPHLRRTRPLAVAVLSAVAALLLTFVDASPAGAHGEEGDLTVQTVEETDPLTISVEVGLLHADDDHLAEGAEVWVTASSATTQMDPVGLEHAGEGSAIYRAEFRVPEAGEWSLEFESSDPAATASASVAVAGAPPPVPTSTIAPTSTTLLVDGDDGVADADDDANGEAAAGEDDSDDDGLSAVVIALGVVGLLVLLGAGVVLLQRRRAG